MWNEYLRNLARLLEKQEISDDASLIIVCNEGDPATIQVREGMSLRFFVENEDQTQLLLKTTVEGLVTL